MNENLLLGAFIGIPKNTKITKETKIFYIASTDILCIPKITKKTKGTKIFFWDVAMNGMGSLLQH